MSTSATNVLVPGHDYEQLPNGVIVVRRHFHDLRADYRKERIPNYLGLVDHDSLRIDGRKAYEKALSREEIKFNALVRLLKDAKLSVIFDFQGWNGAGKSGAITRLFEALWRDNKLFAWIPIGPPTDEELAHDFLERFHRYDRMPQFGQVRCFDRGWPERVMVEKVMKITPREEVEKSYEQIRVWEYLRTSLGHIVIKIWMDITSGEQWKRFQERKSEKPDKLTKADKEERKHRGPYKAAINEMFHWTGSQFAPWNIVSSQNKRYSRVAVLQVGNRVILTKLLEKLGDEELATRLAGRLAHVLREKKLCKILVGTLGEVMDRATMSDLAPRVLDKLDSNEELKERLDKRKLRRILSELLADDAE